MKVTTRKPKVKIEGPKPQPKIEAVKVEEEVKAEVVAEVQPVLTLELAADTPLIQNQTPPSFTVDEVKPAEPVANNPVVINRKPKPKPKYVKPTTAADPPKAVEPKKEDTLEVTNSIKVADIKHVEVKEEEVKVVPPAPKKVQPKVTPKVAPKAVEQKPEPKKEEPKKITSITPKNNEITFKPIFRDEPNPNVTPANKSTQDVGMLDGLVDVLSSLFVTKAELPSLVEKAINELLIKNNK